MKRCSEYLYRWLLRNAPAGKPQEIDLRDFQQKSNYSIKYIKKCFKELSEDFPSLLKLIKKYNSYEFIVTCNHPEEVLKIRQNDTSKRQNDTSKRQKTASNPIKIVPSYIEKKEQQTPEVVVFKNDNNLDNLDLGLKGDNNEIEINKNVNTINQGKDNLPRDVDEKVNIIKEELPEAQITAPLLKLLQEATLNAILNAVKAVKRYKHQKEVKNVTGAIYNAIKETWKPNPEPEAVNGINNPEFKQWYKRAIEDGLIANEPAEYLPLDSNGEPMIRLRDERGFYTICWKRLYTT
jgi:hypothetical protein